MAVRIAGLQLRHRLAVIVKIVRIAATSGRLAIESEYGQGTRLEVRIPK